ncbi:MAG: FG-GAP repeat protein [Nitrospirae bacterium]|nr:FG-GAP repeat protein [Nitrospirota bacterium]
MRSNEGSWVFLFLLLFSIFLLVSEAGAAVLGDVNGDGVPDVIVGSPHNSPNGVSDAGSVYVYSGSNGSLIFKINGLVAGAELGTSVALIGDINGDGREDFAAGAPRQGGGAVYVFSGATGQVLYTIVNGLSNDNFGFSVSSAGDIDGDGMVC